MESLTAPSPHSFPLFSSLPPFTSSLGLFALFTSAAFDYQTDKRLAGAVIACTAFYVMNFAYSVRTPFDFCLPPILFFSLPFLSLSRCADHRLHTLTLRSLPPFCRAFLPSSQWGPLAWVVSAEIFPQRLRGKGMTITTLANWLTNFCIAKAVPVMILPER